MTFKVRIDLEAVEDKKPLAGIINNSQDSAGSFMKKSKNIF
jgi:hypothetical protein